MEWVSLYVVWVSIVDKKSFLHLAADVVERVEKNLHVQCHAIVLYVRSVKKFFYLHHISVRYHGIFIVLQDTGIVVAGIENQRESVLLHAVEALIQFLVAIGRDGSQGYLHERRIGWPIGCTCLVPATEAGVV